MVKKRNFKVLSEETKYQDQWLTVSELKTEKDGQTGSYSVVHKNDCVSVIIENHKKMILFLKQYRFPTEEYAWELPMGGIEDRELPEAAAKRETKEEVGIDVQLHNIGVFHSIPGLMKQNAYVYYGIIGEQETRDAQLYDEWIDEIVERKFFTYNEIHDMIRNHEISDGLTLSSLILLQCKSERKEWRREDESCR